MASSSSASSTVPLPDAVVRISKLVLASYVLDWILIMYVLCSGEIEYIRSTSAQNGWLTM